MATLSMTQIARVAKKAGFSGKNLQIAVAVAYAESTGRTTVVNYLGCTGLWQIYQRVHAKAHPSWTTAWLKVAENNAKAAWILSSHGKNWRPWETYTNGMYKKHMSSAASAIKKAGSSSSSSSSSSSRSSSSTKSSSRSSTSNTNTSTGDTGVVDASLGTSKSTNDAALDAKLAVKVTNSVDDLYVMGSKLRANVRDVVTSANFSAAIGSVTQFDIDVYDPTLSLLKEGYFKKGVSAQYQNFKMVVASVTTKTMGGQEALTVKFRSKVVNDLKKRRGTKVMKKVSPSEFVISECKAVGAKYVVQGSARRTQVARDMPASKTKYDEDAIPSSWTTFNRLAGEAGFVLFECAGVIFFGQPSWLLKQSAKDPIPVIWTTSTVSGNTDDPKRALQLPECTSSIDTNTGADVNVSLPLTRFPEIRLGKAIQLKGVPTFDGKYLITSFDLSLVGKDSTINVKAETPVDPEANPPTAEKSDYTPYSGGLTTKEKSSFTASYKGVMPLKSNVVTCGYGVRGSWGLGYHPGIDYRASVGTKCYAVYNGTIVKENWGSAYGTHIVLKTQYGKFLYAHLSRKVKSSGTVKAGQHIGYTGQTGRAFGPHLHLEFRVSPYRYSSADIRNPSKYLKKTVVGTSSKSTGTVSTGRTGAKTAHDFVALCLKQKGDRYVYGAEVSLNSSNPSVWDCVEKGTLLQTPNGPQPIESLRPGDPVWSINPQTGKIEVKPVRTTFAEISHKAWVVETNGRRARMSYDHHMMVVEKSRTRDEKGRWKPVEWNTKKVLARDVKVDDYVLVSDGLPEVGMEHHLGKHVIDDDLAWFLGFFVGDGSFTTHGVSIAAAKDYQRDLLEGIYHKYYPNGGLYKGKHFMNFNSTQLREDLIGAGFDPAARSHTKIIPQTILGSSHSVKKSFLHGYRGADGHVDKRGNWSFASASKILADQARALAIEVGHRVSKVSVNNRTSDIVIKGVKVKDAKPLHTFDVYPNKSGVRGNDDSVLMGTYGGARKFPEGVTIKRVTASYGTDDVIPMYDVEVADNHTIMFDLVSFQCSELVQWAAHRVGLYMPDGSSNQYSYARKKGKAISISKAIKTKGALLYKGAGGSTHVAVSLGNGKTIEAANSRVGVVSYSAYGRGWSVASLIPGMKY